MSDFPNELPPSPVPFRNPPPPSSPDDKSARLASKFVKEITCDELFRTNQWCIDNRRSTTRKCQENYRQLMDCLQGSPWDAE